MTKAISPVAFPQMTLRRRRMCTGTRGAAARFSTNQNATRRAAPARRAVSVVGVVQPDSPACVSPWTRRSRPPVTAAAPGRSSFGRSAGRDSEITDGASATTSAATGTLTKKAQRQESRSVSRPPRTAPAVKPADIRAPLRPRARSRSGPSLNAVVSRASPAGATAAVARPWRTRAVSRTCGEVASPPSSEDSPRTTMPPTKRRLRPTRSATRPNRRVNPAATRAKEVAIHWRWPRENPSPSPTAGRATFRIEKSTAIMNCAPRRRTRTSFCRPVIRGPGVRGGAVTDAVLDVDMGCPSWRPEALMVLWFR